MNVRRRVNETKYKKTKNVLTKSSRNSHSTISQMTENEDPKIKKLEYHILSITILTVFFCCCSCVRLLCGRRCGLRAFAKALDCQILV